MRSPTPTDATSDLRAPGFRDVLAHIDAHLDDDLSLARLSRVAHSSPFHFHHQFSAHFGMGVHRYVKLARLRRAAFQLAFRRRLRVVEIALANGYESPEAFARAFKKAVGQTPSEFRMRPDWSQWNAMNRRLSEVRACDAGEPREPIVTVDRIPAIRVAALEVRGRPIRMGDALRRFIAWRIENKLSRARYATYNMFHSNAEGDGIDLCVGTDRRVAPNAFGVVEKWTPGGRCAVIRHSGTNESLFDAVRSVMTRWLPRSGESLRDAPLVIRRITLFPDVPEHEADSEVFLPLH